MQSNIKAIVWDVDGTMVDSESLHLRCWDEVLISYGHTLHDLSDAIRETIAGKKPLQIAQEFVVELQLPIEPEALAAAKTELFIELAETELELMPGLEEMLEKFSNEGYKQAIGSSMTAEYVDNILDKHNLRNYFEIIITGGDVSKGKPDPEMYLLVAQKLNLQPDQCVVIEDAANGVAAAKAAGCMCIALETQSGIKQDLSQADKIVTSLQDISINY